MKRDISHSIGRLSICYIFSINGYLLGSFNLLRKLNQAQKLKVLLLSPFIFHNLKEIHVITKFFSKIKLLRFNLLLVILFIFFACLPINSIFNLQFIGFIKQITGFTGGIYYLHLFIFDCCSRFSKIIKNKDDVSCIIIYIICYCISFSCYNILKKSELKYLFV